MNNVIDYGTHKISLDFNSEDIKLNETVTLEYLDIFETLNSIPYFEMVLISKDLASLTELKDIKFSYISDNLTYECNLGVNTIQELKSAVLISGWICKQEDFKVPRTRYLGNNAKTALKRLGLREDNIKLKDNPNMQFFQINQCNAQQTLSVCKAAASTPFWSVGRYSINLDQSDEVVQDVATMQNARVITNTEYNTNRIDSNWISVLSSKNYYRITNISDSEALFNKLDKDQLFRAGIKYLNTGFYSGEYPHPIGTKLENSNAYYNEVKYWVVTSIYYHYIAKAVETDIQYYGIISESE